MAITVGMVSLGCAKNRVDGEMMMATLKNEGFCLVNDAALADVAIVNTCGFIDDAKQESIDEIPSWPSSSRRGRFAPLWSRAVWRSATVRRSARSCPRRTR